MLLLIVLLLLLIQLMPLSQVNDGAATSWARSSVAR
jgi:hypothetical protein